MVRNALSMQNLRSDMSDLKLSPIQPQNEPQTPAISLNARREQPQKLQTLGSRQSMQLCGQDRHTKALMNRIATEQATDADHAEFNRHVQGTYGQSNIYDPCSGTVQHNTTSVDVRIPHTGDQILKQEYRMESSRCEQENKWELQSDTALQDDFVRGPLDAPTPRTQYGRWHSGTWIAYPDFADPEKIHALEDYQTQLMLLEQQNWKRKEDADRDPPTRNPYYTPANVQRSSTSTTSNRNDPLEPKQKVGRQAWPHPDYMMQLMQLEQENKRRLQRAREEQDRTVPGPGLDQMREIPRNQHSSHVPEPSESSRQPSLRDEVQLDYETQLERLEKENPRRLQLARQSLDSLRFPKATGSAAEVYCKPFCDFLTNNPTVFHAVDATKQELKGAGWTQLSERDTWTIKPSGRYFVERNGSSLIAFVVGANYEPGNGAAILAGHVDALCAKLKPVSEVPNKAGYLQLGVAPYAGAMSDTWWDRDLGIGGRVLVKEGDKIVTKLVKLDWPIARIPSLAPHFGAAAQPPFNKETQMTPIIGLEGVDSPPIPITTESAGAAFVSKQPPALVRAIGNVLGLTEQTYGNIVNWELELFDVQPATVGGLNKEFIYGGRIDDKLCSWAAMQALTGSSLYDTRFSSLIKVVAWFDNEEIGSQLRQGAKSNFLPQVLERAVGSMSKHNLSSDLMGRTYANSFILSSDVTHAVNPNFLNAYLGGHMPHLNTGLTIAADANGHMTTDAVSTAMLQRCADRVGATLQVFQIRNDSRSGGTVGPMLSSMTGIRAIDAGMPQLSMHSIRATTGSLDPGLGVITFTGFLNGFEQVDKEFRS